MAMEITKIAASHFDGDLGATGSIFTVAPGVIAALTVSVPNGFVFFVTEFGGNVTTSDVDVKFRDDGGRVLAQWSEFPDFPHIVENIPFLKRAHKGTISFLFQNSSNDETTVTFVVNGILIPESKEKSFIAVLKRLLPRKTECV